jgi:AraC-like DNA-binding protein
MVVGGVRPKDASEPSFVEHDDVIEALTPDRSDHPLLRKVALDAGFGSLSRFNAAFKAFCGCSPREYRAMHRM